MKPAEYRKDGASKQADCLQAHFQPAPDRSGISMNNHVPTLLDHLLKGERSREHGWRSIHLLVERILVGQCRGPTGQFLGNALKDFGEQLRFRHLCCQAINSLL